MKDSFHRLLKLTLTSLAKLAIWRFRPGVVGVTGTVGKTSTKLAIKTVIGSDRNVRWGKGNLNNEVGLSLPILGDWDEERLKLVSRETPPGEKIFEKVIFWLKVLSKGLIAILFSQRRNYPEILVLEYGADRRGDLKNLIAIARPNISVITAIGDIPAHIEFYNNPDEVAREKARLIECLPSAGYAVLNFDDPQVMKLRDRTRAHLMTFGFHDGAQVKISGFEHRTDAGEPVGITFKLEYGGSFVPVRMDGVFGKTHAYSAAAAACIGLIFGMNLVAIAEALSKHKPAPSRLEIFTGLNGSFVIDDSYNASLLSMQAGLHTLADLPAKRRVAILGDMLELGPYSMEAHERIGKVVPKCVDILVAIGPRAKLIAETVKKTRFPKRNIYEFTTVDDAKTPVPDLIKKGDVVLVKGSHAMRLSEIVDALRMPVMNTDGTIEEA